jgi:Tfp pilus assembly protein PilF
MTSVRAFGLLVVLLALTLPAGFLMNLGPLAATKGQQSDDAVANEQCMKGLEAMGEQKYNKAITAFTKAIERDPKFVDAYICRGEAFRASGNLDRAQYDFDCAVRLDPSNEEARELATELRKERAGVGE